MGSTSKKYIMMGVTTLLTPIGKMILNSIIEHYTEKQNALAGKRDNDGRRIIHRGELR